MALLCEICQELITASEDVRTTICGHLFHWNCISQWFSLGNRTCPHCRQSSSSNLQRIFLTCLIGDDKVHLDKDCDAVKEKLVLSEFNLGASLKHKDKIQQKYKNLKLKYFSMKGSRNEEIDKIAVAIRKLEVKLISTLTKSELDDQRIKQRVKKVFSVEESLRNCEKLINNLKIKENRQSDMNEVSRSKECNIYEVPEWYIADDLCYIDDEPHFDDEPWYIDNESHLDDEPCIDDELWNFND